jgi:hypothetical protein
VVYANLVGLKLAGANDPTRAFAMTVLETELEGRHGETDVGILFAGRA